MLTDGSRSHVDKVRALARRCARRDVLPLVLLVLLVVILLCVVASQLLYASSLALDPFSLEGYPEAKCMDGSPAWYYYKQAEPGSERRWVLWLPGCGWCWDETSCREYSPNNAYNFADAEPIAVPALLDSRSSLGGSHIASVLCCTGDA